MFFSSTIVSMTTGMSASSGSALSAVSTAQPSMPGIITSSVIDVGLQFARQLQAFLAARAPSQRDSLLLRQEACQQVAHRGVVVDDQHHVASRAMAAGLAGSGAGRGFCVSAGSSVTGGIAR